MGQEGGVSERTGWMDGWGDHWMDRADGPTDG